MGIKREERSHYDRHGRAKETYKTLKIAQEQADYLNIWKMRQWYYPTEAYECWICDMFHVGARRYGDYITRKQVQIIEIGERAYRELIFENRRRKVSRYRRIFARYIKAVEPGSLERLYTIPIPDFSRNQEKTLDSR